MSDLVQTGFFDLELDAPQKTWHIGLEDKLQDTLRQRAAKIKTVVAQANFLIGEELATAQKELTYKNGGFVKWLEEEVGIDNQRAYEFIQIWEHYKMFPLSGNISSLGKKVLLAGAQKDVPESARQEIVTRHEAGEKVTLAVSDEIIERHKAELEELEEARQDLQREFDLFKEDIEREREEKQRELDIKKKELELFRWEKDLEDSKHEGQQKQLQEDIDRLKQEKVKTIQEDTPETKAKLEEVEKQLKEIEAQKQKLADDKKEQDSQLKQKTDRVKELTNQIKEYNVANKQEKHNEKVRAKCRQMCDAYSQGRNLASTRMVTASDAQQAFSQEEWAMIAEEEAGLRRAADELTRLRESVTSQFVDATSVVEAPLFFIEAGNNAI
jgi:hypothetical protein